MAKNKNNILVILASPRSNSNSSRAAGFLSSLTTKPSSIIPINIYSLDIKPCIACLKCETTFKCTLKDDAEALKRAIGQAHVVIIASPIYFTGVPSQLKAFIDRSLPEWYLREEGGNRKPEGKPETGNRKPEKKGIIILTAGESGKKNFMPAESEIRSFFAVHGIKPVAVLKLGGLDKAGEFEEKKEKYRAMFNKTVSNCKI